MFRAVSSKIYTVCTGIGFGLTDRKDLNISGSVDCFYYFFYLIVLYFNANKVDPDRMPLSKTSD